MAEARRGALLQGPEKTATRKETKEKLAGRTRSRYNHALKKKCSGIATMRVIGPTCGE